MKYKKIKHFNLPNNVHELTFSCFKNQDFLKDERFCRWFLDSLDKARIKYSFKLLAYVIMPNHVHLLIYPMEENYDTSKILSGIKVSLSRKVVNLARNTRSSLLKRMSHGNTSGLPVYRFWQRGGGYDRNLVSKKAILDSIEYMHNNPVRKGLVNSPEDWVWSSAGYYAGSDDNPIKIDDDVLELLA